MNKTTRHVAAGEWQRMEAYLNSVIHTLPPSARKIAQLLLEAFPDYSGDKSRLRETEEVRGYVRALKDADSLRAKRQPTQTETAVKTGFSKIPYSDTEFTESESSATFRGTYDTSQFDSPEAYIKSKNVDLEKWQVKELGLKTYQGYIKNAVEEIEVVTLNSVFATFKPREVYVTENSIKALLSEFKVYQAPVFKLSYQPQQECAAVLNLYDAHIDKVCLVTETGYGSTIEDNVQEFERLFDQLLTDCLKYAPELIYFPVGHDFFNTNSPANTTKRGTPQDTLIKSEDSFKIGTRLLRRCIDKASQVAKVKVIVIKANHSEDKDFYLGQVLEAVYELNENVEVENSRLQRKYEQYGINLLGFAHGDKEKGKTAQLPLRMAEEVKHLWAATTYRTFLLGDIHHKEEYSFLRAKDFPGCLVKFLRSVGTTDLWHYDSGYIGVPRTGEVEIHAKQGGMIGHHFAHAQYRNTPLTDKLK